jgi:hypothetical protein
MRMRPTTIHVYGHAALPMFRSLARLAHTVLALLRAELCTGPYAHRWPLLGSLLPSACLPTMHLNTGGRPRSLMAKRDTSHVTRCAPANQRSSKIPAPRGRLPDL